MTRSRTNALGFPPLGSYPSEASQIRVSRISCGPRGGYDGRGNLVKVELPGGAVIEYVIDASDRRVAKKKNGVVQRRWLYRDTTRIVAELDGSGSVLGRFVYGASSNLPELAFRADGSRVRVIGDHLGSPRAVVLGTTGQVLQELEHDAWGNELRNTDPSWLPFGFAGGLYDRDTGLVHFGKREYDPEIGRWATKDPILFKGGDSNLYSYVGADPVNEVDSEGLSKFDKFYGLPKKFWNWAHRQYKNSRGVSDLDEDEARELHREWKEMGEPGPDNKGKHRKKGEGGDGDWDDWLDMFLPIPAIIPLCFVTPESPLCICPTA